MAGKSWKDLKKKKPRSRAAAFDPGAFGKHSLPDLHNLPGASPKLTKLMAERQQLEDKMNTLSAGGGQDLNARDAARFQVPSMRSRLDKQRVWENKREAMNTRIEEQRASARGAPQPQRPRTAPVPSAVGRALPDAGTGERTGIGAQRPRHAAVGEPIGTAPRSGLNNRPRTRPQNDFVRRAGKAKDWLSERDAQVERARDNIRGRLNDTPDLGALGGLKDKMDGFSRDLDDADRKMAEQGGMDAERDQLREMRNGNIDGMDDVQKYSKMLDGPRKAVRKIDDAWTKKRDQIEGPMDKIGAYKDMIDRRLSTKDGGSGDLFERSHKARLAALKRKREQKEQEAKDDKRRERALKSQKERKANA